jgi:cytochrome c oxidase assembly protein subunit 15
MSARPLHSPALAEHDARSARGLALGFALLCALTTGLIVLGALVRAHGAGLACPDWPLCFGELLPEMDLKVGFEWSHRLVAGSVSLIFLGLGIALLRRPELRRSAGRLYGVTGGLLLAQVILGALTVWQLLAEWTVTSHLITGNAFNAGLLLLALRLAENRAGPASLPTARERAGVTIVGVLLALQMVLGGLVASGYAGLACPEWPTCNGGVWFPSLGGSVGLHLAHRMTGYALAGGILGVAVMTGASGRLGQLMWVAAALVAAQLCVGVANVLLGLPVEVTGLHSALAALLVLTLVAALRESWRGSAEGAIA